MSGTNPLSMTGAVTVSTALDVLAATDDGNTGATIPLNALAGSGAVNVREAGGRGLPLVKVGGPGSYSGDDPRRCREVHRLPQHAPHG